MEMDFQFRRQRAIGLQRQIVLFRGEMFEQRLAVELHHVADLGGLHIIGALRGGLADQFWFPVRGLASGNSPVRICTIAAVKCQSALMKWPFRPRAGIELAFAVQRIKFVAAADMGFADENLRKCRARAGAIPHLLAQAWHPWRRRIR